MIINLLTFQRQALEKLRKHCAAAHREYRQTGQNQVVSFTAPTGAGKTIIMASLIEDILCGTATYVEQPDAIFVWLSDSPELNLQSKAKIDRMADKISRTRCVVINDDSFDRETLEAGHIYFLNTQKLSRTSNLTHPGELRQYTIWETLANTIATKADRLYLIIDEAHRGMKDKEAGRATTIMQKFILGSPKDNLPPAPVVIGMSATIERFNQLVKNSSATNRPVRVSAKDVQDSGLLKDRVIIYYPPSAEADKDMAVLQAATDEWMEKCRHWELFCKGQGQAMVRPLFVVQVLNGTGNNLSDTPLDECLRTIAQRAKRTFGKGEVVHAFGDTKGKINIGGLDVTYIEPSKIQDDPVAQVVFFKETLSTGWDCPRAETMMSFRRYVDATAIAQLLGRMVRTPLQQHILADDTLNNVQLFLPHFDADNVKRVVDELQNEEGGALPVDVEGDELERGAYVVLTAKAPKKTMTDPGPYLPGMDPTDPPQTTEGAGGAEPQPQQQPQQQPHLPTKPIQKPPILEPTQPEPEIDFGEIDRPAIIRFINELALPSYHVRSFQMNDYLVSLLALCRFLLTSGLDVNAKETVVNRIVERIHNYVLSLKATGKYAAAKAKVENFEMLVKVYNAFGEAINTTPMKNLFSEINEEIDRQARIAEKKLGSEGVVQAYGKQYQLAEAPNDFLIDAILFTGDDEQMRLLHEAAKQEYYRLNDTYRKKTVHLPDELKKKYSDIVRDSAEVSQEPFFLGENILFRSNEDGETYDDHLFVGEDGKVRIRLNSWERRVVEEERKRADFRCWYRNPSRGKDALTLCHYYKGSPKAFYPDFLIVRKEGANYVLDILEPHEGTRDDNVSKAKALAQYATENTCIGRAQLIRVVKTSTGEALRRLDFAAHSALREKVTAINTNAELDNLFTQYGEE